MNEPSQDDLFNLPVHRLHRAGQHTSRAALEKTVKQRISLHKNVYERLKLFGDDGAIPEQVAYSMAAELIDVRRAFSVLKKRGKILPTGGVRANERGNDCEIWRAV